MKNQLNCIHIQGGTIKLPYKQHPKESSEFKEIWYIDCTRDALTDFREKVALKWPPEDTFSGKHEI